MQVRVDLKFQNTYFTFRQKQPKDNYHACNGISFGAKIDAANKNPQLISKALNNQIAIVKLNGELNKILSKIKPTLNNSITQPLAKNNNHLFSDELSMVVSDMKLASKNPNINIPNSLLICGDISSTDKVFEEIISELKASYDITEFSVQDKNTEIIKELTKILNINRQNYLSNKRRNVIYIKDAEKILNPSVDMFDYIGITLTQEDKSVLSECKGDMDIISFFKTLLDNSALAPENGTKQANGYATTFLFTSQNPHLIHPDLITKNSRINSFFYDIPNGKSMKDLILRTINKYDPVFEDQFGENDWNTILKLINPNSKKGGLSVKQVEDIISGYYNKSGNKTTNILQDELNIVKLLLESPRNIKSSECKKFSYLAKILGERGSLSEKFSIQDLIIQKKLGLLTKKLNSVYESEIKKLNDELEILNQKLAENKLSKKGLKRRNTIINIINSI